MKQKRKKLGRKLLGFLLTLAMVVGLMPGIVTGSGITVHAAEDDQGYTLVDDNWILDSDHNGPVKVNGNDVTIDLNGHSIIGNGATSTIIIIEGCTLTLKDSAEGGKVTGGGGEVGGGVQVSNNTTFHLQGGEISGNTATNAGGVAVGIGATFDMTGGVICNNTATNGGGVYSSGTFHMSGGKISGNIALDSGVGGGVVAQSGSFTVSGTSQIVNNIAHEGGGVYNSTEMIVNGGEINANTAYGSGGGIYNTRDGSLSVNGGTIDNNNTGNWAGGGVFNAGILDVSDGSISNNTARTEGGAIYSYDTLTISGGHISNNNSGVKGFAGICAQNGTFTLSGNPVIEDNKHNGSEEDICLYPSVIITVPGELTMTNTMSLRRTDSNGHNSWTGVIAQGSGEYMLTEEDAAKFVATTPDRIVKYVNNKAQMNERYHVFYDANGGTGTVPTDDTWYESGDTVTVKETSGVAPNFGWSRNIYGSGETYTENATFEITSNTTLYAKRVDGIVESTSMLGRYIHEPGRNQSASLPLSEDHIYITGVSGTHKDVSGSIVLRNKAAGSYWELYFKGNNEAQIYHATPYPPLGVYFDRGSGTSEDPYVTGWNYNRANGTELSVFHPGDRINGVDVDAKTSTGITFVAASDKWVRFSGDDNYYPLSATESTTFTGLTADTQVYVYGNYKIVYNGNGNTGGSTSNSESFPAGSDGTIAENGFVKELSRFKSWNTKADGSGIRYYPGDHIVSDESVTLYAQWELYQYKITYDGNGNDSGYTDTTITEIGTVAEVAANGFGKTSYKFSGWNTERNGSGESYAVGDQISDNTNRTLYAQWIPSDKTFTFSAPGTAALSDGWNSAGSISVSPGEDVFPEGNKLVVSAESENGWNVTLNTTQVSYGLKDTENGSDTTVWEFTKEDVNNGKTYPLGIQITVPDDLAYGIYSDTITFKGEFVSTKPQYLNELVQYNDYGNMNFSCLYYFEQILEHGDYCGKTIDAELAKSIARYKKSETGQNCIVFYGADGDDGLFARSDGELGRIYWTNSWDPDNFGLDRDWYNVYAYGIPSTAVGAAAEPFTTEVKTLGTMTVTHKVAEPATVAEAPVAVEDLTYTGDELTLITAGSTTEGTMQYTLGTDDSTVPQSGWSENLPIGKDAGTYYVWYKVLGDDNHFDSTPSCITVLIAKKAAPTELTDEQKPAGKENLTYTGEPQELVTAPTSLPEGYEKVQYSTDDGKTWTDDIPAGTNVDDYTVKVRYVGDDNHESFDGEDIPVTIGKKAAPTELTDEQKPAGKENLTYTGEPQELVTAPTSLPEGYEKVQYSTDDGKTWTDDIPAGTNVDDYTVKVRYVGDDNHESFDGEDIPVTIGKQAAPALADDQKPTANEDLSYTGEAQALVTAPASLPTGYTKVQYSLDGTNWSDEIPIGTDAGDYIVKVKYIGDNNHTTFNGTDIAVSIEKAVPDYKVPQDITATYGQTLEDVTLPAGWSWKDAATTRVGAFGENTFAATYTPTDTANYKAVDKNITIIVNKATATIGAAPAGVDRLLYTGSAQELVTAGSDVTGGTLKYALGKNKTVAPANETAWGTDIPTATNAGTYYVWYRVKGDSNHNDVAAASVTVTINKKLLTITAGAKSKVYGEKDPELTYDSTGLVEGDIITGSLTRDAGENAGTYAITQGTVTASDNYELSYVPALLTITKADSNTTAPTANELNYSGSAQELVTAGTPTGGTLVYSTDGESYNEMIPTGINAGEYTVYYKVIGDANHNDKVVQQVTVTILARTLDIKADEKSKTYGEDDPALTYTSEGLVEGDSITGALSRAEGENVGTYAIEQGTLTAGDNYIITYTGANLAITEAASSVTTEPVTKMPTYNGGKQTLVAGGEVAGGTMQYALGTDAEIAPTEGWSTSIPAETDAGTYYVWYRAVGDNNHSDVEATCVSVDIEKAAITITADDKSSQKGAELQELSWQVSGDYVSGDELGISASTTADSSADAGVYPITVSWNDNANYEATLISGKYTITAPEESGRVETKTIVADNVPSCSISNLTTELARSLATEEELIRVQNGENLLIYLDMENIDDSVSATDKSLVEAAVKASSKDAKVGMYLDLTLYKKVGDGAATKVTDTKESRISVTIEVPDSLKGGSDVTRTFYIIRVHDGATDILATTTETTITFETDKFSTYALAYSDKSNGSPSVTTPAQQEKAPKTGDNFPSVWLWALILAGGLVPVGYAGGRHKGLERK